MRPVEKLCHQNSMDIIDILLQNLHVRRTSIHNTYINKLQLDASYFEWNGLLHFPQQK